MIVSRLAVKGEWSQNGSEENGVRLLGLDLLTAFVQSADTAEDENLRAWAYEMMIGQWRDVGALLSVFAHVSAPSPPVVRFKLASCAVSIDTLIDFRTGVVLVTKVDRTLGNAS